ncbi:MAG: hypothetical protein A2W11_12785 [Ignavibacteria bacterium RBG_16_35_7]|nr:MAG: hypothetical protein A2W11_12785 [Ignavibacteria bacterium RBG_16_35_7]
MNNANILRDIITDGTHTREVINIIGEDIRDPGSIESIIEKAKQIIQRSVDPFSNQPQQQNDGLLYGLIQSGKTSIITVATAMAADNGFQCIIILTSDIDVLYDQTLERLRKALRGLNILGKNDFREEQRFRRQVRNPPFVVVCSKNGNRLASLLNAFQNSSARNLSVMLIDDEADQASLNTNENRDIRQLSRVNNVISSFRDYFTINTYVQVTATPQALFLQRPDGSFRPAYTVLSEPGPGYIGGDTFFTESSQYISSVDINEVNSMVATNQPANSDRIPAGLRRALFTFFIGATSRLIDKPVNNYAFLCHVSLNTRDHLNIVNLIDRFKERTIQILNDTSTVRYSSLITELRECYNNLISTETNLNNFDQIINKFKFYIRGTNIKLINASSNDEINLDSAYNIFVGGNKLGRGVTIKNLLVSYYGRNPRRPNSDTVLQHARMYGYRSADLGITRIFLPSRLEQHFRLIHEMENSLRSLIRRHPVGHFEGLYISNPLQATRRNVLDPNSIGLYTAGSYCNPMYPLRKKETASNTQWIDQNLQQYSDEVAFYETTIDSLIDIIKKCEHDPNIGADLWNKKNIISALEKTKDLFGNKAYLRVRRNRNLHQPRNETQGFLTGGEAGEVPNDAPTLFIYRLNKRTADDYEIWWPLIRFSEGNYVFAFSFKT